MPVFRSAPLAAAICTSLPLLVCSLGSQAAFVEDSSARLDLRNFYLNRDFRDGAGQSKREEWAQGFILDLRSGYTDGTLGFGVDALGMLGLKLDSGRGRTGTGLLPTHDDGRAADEYSKLGLTAKVRVSASELKVGTLIPRLPTVRPNDGRILPQVFRGGQLTANELEGLTLNLGRLQRVTAREASHSERLALNNKNRRFSGGAAESAHFDFAGADYRFTPALTGSYHFGQLDDVYNQHFLGLQHSLPLGEGELKTDLRLSISDDQGRALGGEVDNRALNGMLTYSQAGHSIGAGYQRMFGDTGFAYIDGSDPYLVNFLQLNDFAQAEERSWQARYDYDFSALSVPGLTFMARYVSGSQAQVTGSDQHGREWERNIDVQYKVQSGALKNVGVRWRHASHRANFTRGTDEHRLIVSYSLPIW